MKKLLLLGFFLLFSIFWAANSTETITFQGYLTNADGSPINGDRVMAFAVYGSKDGSDLLFKVNPAYRKVTVYNGNYATKLTFDSTQLNALNRVQLSWMQVWISSTQGVDPSLDNSNSLSPRIQFTAVPYALNTRGVGYDNSTNTVKVGSTYVSSATAPVNAGDGMVVQGWVGIGTTSPQGSLDISGIPDNGSVFLRSTGEPNLDIKGGLNNFKTLRFSDGTDGTYKWRIRAVPANSVSYPQNSLQFWSNSVGAPVLALRYDNGNVGIGTTDPGADSNLAVIDGVSTSVLIGVDQTDRFGKIAYNSNVFSLQGGVAGGTTRPLAMQTGGGNVGIGTTAPGDRFSIVDASVTGSSSVSMLIGADQTNRFGRIAYGSDVFSLQGGVAGTTRPLVMQTDGGNVGIGTTAPTDDLSIVNNDVTVSILVGADQTNRFGRIAYKSDVFSLQGGVAAGTTRPLALQAISGNVGIGTTAPLQKLDVRGYVKIDVSAAAPSYDVWIQGGDSATAGIARNLAMLGDKANDILYVNYGSEYTNGTYIGGDVHAYGGGKIYDAVWNDLAEFRPLAKNENKIPGKCYVITKSGLKLSAKRAEIGTAGIYSDTFGFALGGSKKDKNKIPIAISGWALAYVDKDYPIGTALVSGPDGKLTAATRKEKSEYPERIVGIVDVQPEKYNNLKIDGRYWIKVK